ncbi:formylglycine-generating enzyme family protein [bacterium]|nr:formylglycine-generating enzyme family protein [bacterium]
MSHLKRTNTTMMVESRTMRMSRNTGPVRMTAGVSLLAAVILLFGAAPAIHAQEPDTTGTAADTMMMFEEQPGDTLAPDVFEMFDEDTESMEPDSMMADTTMSDTIMMDMMIPDSLMQDSLGGFGTMPDSVMVDSLGMPIYGQAMTPPPALMAPENMKWISAGTLPDPLRKFRDTEQEVAWTNGFYIDENEVTNAEFADFLSSGYENRVFFDERMYITEVEDGVFVADEGREDLPVSFVSWFGAFAFSQSVGKSLPTEEEWILACLGSYDDNDLTMYYPWGQTKPDSIQANLLDVSKIGAPENVRSYPSSITPTGLYDMAGNVSEWTLTNFKVRAQSSMDEETAEYENPNLVGEQSLMPDSTGADSLNVINVGPQAAEEEVDTTVRFVIKGGSYLDPPANAQLNRRATRFPHERYQYVGFRCVRREGTR